MYYVTITHDVIKALIEQRKALAPGVADNDTYMYSLL